MGYKCMACGAIKENNERYWQVKTITSDGKMTFQPTCSEHCAEQLKNNCVRLHQSRVDDIEHQCFQIKKWIEPINEEVQCACCRNYVPFTRTCRCGFEIIVNEEGKELNSLK